MLRTAAAAVLFLLCGITAAYADEFAMAYVPGDLNPTIEVVALDDPSNPYAGQYSLLDRWAFENFSYYMSDENTQQTRMVLPNIEQGLKRLGLEVRTFSMRSDVELDPSGEKGYLLPALRNKAELTSFFGEVRTLGELYLKTQPQPPERSEGAEKIKGPYFWSVGIMDEAAMREYEEAIYSALAPHFPRIPEWMVCLGCPGDKYFLLPDGGAVIARPYVKDDISQRQSVLSRYSSDGELLKQAEGDYMTWESQLLFDPPRGHGSPYFREKEHYDKSGRLTGTGNNIRNTSRYTIYVNDDRDGFLAVIDYWEGKILTPEETDLARLKLDPYPLFQAVDYDAVAWVHETQEASEG